MINDKMLIDDTACVLAAGHSCGAIEQKKARASRQKNAVKHHQQIMPAQEMMPAGDIRHEETQRHRVKIPVISRAAQCLRYHYRRAFFASVSQADVSYMKNIINGKVLKYKKERKN